MISDSFSLLRGGPVYRLLHWLGALRAGVPTAPLVLGVLVLVSFVPLMVFAGMDGMLWPSADRIALLGDHAVIARLLVAVPILVLGARPCDEVLHSAVRYIGRSGLIEKSSREAFDRLVHHGHALRDSYAPEAICALIAVLSAFSTDARFSHVPGFTHWATEGGALTKAGEWFAIVSAPAFRFVALVWVWRFALWSYWLWRFSRLRLALFAAHPDGAGGLGFFGPGQAWFAILTLAGSTILCGNALVQMEYAHVPLQSFQWELLGCVAGSVAVVFAPLLFLMKPLVRARRHGMHALGVLGQAASRAFAAHWDQADVARSGESLLESPNPSAIADFTAMYGTARTMAVIPVNKLSLLSVALASALPIVPLVLHAVSIDELLRRLLGALA
ncbi:hypothetical protein LF41_3093 [Lysobacter dokdonensis DS-58]|uniref:Transmembrane protein n=1 Tax=Lysobacter dokdonensis DS-58 TaxID=1300345 RepID=A0A0A2WMC6_9GAMM|nr:hypothetical protein [Lysobacter dokdonensis]KGQ19440.1 hypothetical protein LF41_3093 [Lysobacter dokdonensis DS-58]